MSKLDELIKELCPEGVEYRELQDILKIRNGSDYKSFGEGEYPVYGSGGIMTYVDRYAYDKPSVLIPRKGSIDKLYYVDTPFWNVDTVFYTEIDTKMALPRYVYHCLLREHLEKLNTAGGVPSLTQKVLNRVRVPVPPLEVQREIVRVLDNFTFLSAELSAELSARRKQYEYYSQKLLNGFKSNSRMVHISELGKWQGGKTPSMQERKYWENGDIPWISSKDMKSPILHDTEDHITELALCDVPMNLLPEESVAIVTRSGILKHTFPVAYIPFKTTVNQDIKALTVAEGVSARYVSLVMQAYSEDIRTRTKKQGGTVDSLDFDKVLDYQIPLPDYDVQLRIVNVLDHFETICSDLSIGLPAEIEARQKQYEYYRDLLLTFAESGSSILTDRQTDRQTDRLK